MSYHFHLFTASISELEKYLPFLRNSHLCPAFVNSSAPEMSPEQYWWDCFGLSPALVEWKEMPSYDYPKSKGDKNAFE